MNYFDCLEKTIKEIYSPNSFYLDHFTSAKCATMHCVLTYIHTYKINICDREKFRISS